MPFSKNRLCQWILGQDDRNDAVRMMCSAEGGFLKYSIAYFWKKVKAIQHKERGAGEAPAYNAKRRCTVGTAAEYYAIVITLR